MKVLRRSLLFAGVVLVLAGFAFWLRPLDFYDTYTYLEQSLHGVRNQTITVDGIRVHYEVAGPAGGQPIVLVHGLGGRAENWRNLAPYLARAGFRVYMPDLVGFGASAQPADFSYSVHDQATFIVHFLDALSLQQVDLGGWSMGGWIAQVVAVSHPERVRRLVVFDSAGLYVVPNWDTRLFAPVSADQLTALDALLTPNPPRIPKFIAKDVLRVSRQTNWVVNRTLAQMFTGRDVTDALLPKLQMPVLIEWGVEDRIIPLSQGEKIHSLIAQSQMDTYNGCGHLAPLDCAGAMAPNVIRFLEQPANSAPLPAPSLAKLPVKPQTQQHPTHPSRDSALYQSPSAATASSSN